MAVLNSLCIELCSVTVHEDAYEHENVQHKWDDLVRRCVVGYRIYFDGKVIGEAVGNAFPSVVSIANFIGFGCSSGDIFLADDMVFTINRNNENRNFTFSVNEHELRFDCDKNQLIAFLITMSGEIIQGAKQLGFDIGPDLGLHINQD